MMKRVMCIWFPRWQQERTRVAGLELAPPQRLQARTRRAAPGRAAPVEDSSLVALAHTAARQFSPVVGVAEPDWSPDEMADSLLCDVTGCAPLFGGEAALVEQATAAFARHGLTVRAAVADTVGAAWALVRTETAPAGREADSASTSVQALRLPPATLATLARLGVRRVDQLERLPRPSLAARCGQRTLERLDQALGRRAEVIAPERPPTRHAVEWTFEPATDNADALRSTMAHLTEVLTRQLRAQDLGVERLECRLRLERGRPLTATVELYRPTAKAQHLAELIELQWDHLRPAAAVQAIELEVSRAAHCPASQTELFASGTASGNGAESVAALVDRLASRLGRTAVLTARLSPEVQPEQAVEYGSALDRRPPQRASQPASQPAALRQRPLRLQGPPLAISVRTAVPAGRPVAFTWRGREHRLAQVWGPERIETGWWRAGPIRRDYYRVDTENGCRFWLFCRLSDGQWFLHGWFE